MKNRSRPRSMRRKEAVVGGRGGIKRVEALEWAAMGGVAGGEGHVKIVQIRSARVDLVPLACCTCVYLISGGG